MAFVATALAGAVWLISLTVFELIYLIAGLALANFLLFAFTPR
jgi:hypothetical protein